MPQTIGPYELLDKLGSGGMGTVWRARDTRSDHIVAVKVLREDAPDDPELARRFSQEARTLTRLDHPNIVRMYEAGVDGDREYIAMELVAGDALDRRIRRDGALPPDEALRIAIAVAQALEHAHGQSIVHRDIKSANIILGADGAVKILDFGIARILDATRVTRTGTFLGSLAYAAPEAIDGLSDARSDMYSLGIVLYEALTGRVPFPGPTPSAFVDQHRRARPNLDEIETLSSDLASVVRRLLEKDPDDRFQSARHLLRLLRAEREALIDLPTPPLEAPSVHYESLPTQPIRERAASSLSPVAGPAIVPHPRSRRTPRVAVGAVAFVAVLAIVGGVYLTTRRGSDGAAADVAADISPAANDACMSFRSPSKGYCAVAPAGWGFRENDPSERRSYDEFIAGSGSTVAIIEAEVECEYILGSDDERVRVESTRIASRARS